MDLEIEVLLMKFDENHLIFRVRWWIDLYRDYYDMKDRVSQALIQSLKDDHVRMPYSSSLICDSESIESKGENK